MFDSPLNFSHKLLDYHVVNGDQVIDATVGNGNDTVKLAALVGQTGKVYGFDVQEQAIEETKKKLTLTGLADQVALHHFGHEDMDSVITQENSITAIVFNLGYLTRSDKSVITKPDTTLAAITKGLKFLRKGGIILVMVYSGHEGGSEEKNAVLSYAQSLPQKEYNVFQYSFINQINSPPFLIGIEKR